MNEELSLQEYIGNKIKSMEVGNLEEVYNEISETLSHAQDFKILIDRQCAELYKKLMYRRNHFK